MVILRLALCILRLIHRQGFLEIGPWAPNLRAQARVAHFSALGRRHADPSSQPAVTQPSEITGFRGTVGAWRGRLPMLKKGSRAEPPTMPEAWGRNMASAWGATDRPQQERRWRGQPTGLGVGQPSWPGQVPTEREAGPVLRPGRCLKPSSLLQPPPGAGPEARPTLPRAGGALPGLSGSDSPVRPPSHSHLTGSTEPLQKGAFCGNRWNRKEKNGPLAVSLSSCPHPPKVVLRASLAAPQKGLHTDQWWGEKEGGPDGFGKIAALSSGTEKHAELRIS